MDTYTLAPMGTSSHTFHPYIHATHTSTLWMYTCIRPCISNIYIYMDTYTLAPMGTSAHTSIHPFHHAYIHPIDTSSHIFVHTHSFHPYMPHMHPLYGCIYTSSIYMDTYILASMSTSAHTSIHPFHHAYTHPMDTSSHTSVFIH